MTKLNPKLLTDLARLAAKYKPKDWEQLGAWLDDERQRERLRTLLVELGNASGTRPRSAKRRGRRPSRTAKVRESVAKIRVTDPARADLLDDVWLKLRERELLPTMPAVRAFAEAMGAKGLASTRRDQAVTELMERLIELPADTLEHRMRRTVVEDRKLGEEYEQWVRLILGRPPGTNDR